MMKYKNLFFGSKIKANLMRYIINNNNLLKILFKNLRILSHKFLINF